MLNWKSKVGNLTVNFRTSQKSDFRFSDIVQDRFLAVKIQKVPTLKLILIKIFRRNYIFQIGSFDAK